MKSKNNRLILFVIFLLQFSAAFSQIDTSFWFATGWVTPDHTRRDQYKVHIGGPGGTVVRLRQPAAIAPNRYDTTFTIPASGLFDYTFWRDATPTNAPGFNRGYDSLEVRPADQVVPYGLYISSTSNITVVFDYVTASPNFLNTETLSMKGQNGLGTEFITPFQTIYRNRTLGSDLAPTNGIIQPKQQFNIVASAPNTTVWITPRCNVVGHPANITYSVYLPNAGSAYTAENLVQNTHVAGNNLSGSLITSSRPIAVTVTDDSVNNPDSDSFGGIGCFDLMADQIVPVDIVGRDYIVNLGQLFVPNQVAPGNPGMRESTYIVGTENFTQLTINDGVITTTLINKGETYRYLLTQPLTYVNANKNVYVIHASGYGCELGEAILPPLSCAGSSLVAFSRNSAQRFSLNILCKSGAQSTFTLNDALGSVNVPITAGNFTLVPGTGTLAGGPFYGAQINLNSIGTLPIGGYTIANTSTNTAIREFALAVFDGSLSSGGLYHYMSSFLRKTVVTTQSIAPICAGAANTVALTGTISGAALTGGWSTNGGGTIEPVYTSTAGVVSTIYTLSPLEASTTTSLSITFTLTSIGCSPKSQTVSMLINPQPIVTAGSGTIMCKNNITPVALTGTVIYGSGSWSGGNGGQFGVPGANTTYTPSGLDLIANTITLTLTGTSTLGCLPTVTTVTVGFTDPPIPNPGASTIVCTNSSSFVLNGTIPGGASGIWNSSGTGLYFPNNAVLNPTYNLSVGDLTLTSIVFSLTSIPVPSTGCAAETRTMVVNVIPKPIVSAGPDFSVCASNTVVTLNGTISGAATTGSWSTPNGTGAFPPPNAVPTATYLVGPNDVTTGSVTIVLNSYPGTCPSANDTVNVYIVSDPILSVNANTTVCKNSVVPCTGTITGAITTGFWTASPGGGAFTPSNNVMGADYTPSASDISAGTIVITLHSDPTFCGTTQKSFTVTVINSPEANFTYPTFGRCLGNPVNFTDASLLNGSPSLNYNWNFGDGTLSTSTSTNPIFTYTNSGSYLVTLTVTGSNNCNDTITRRINIAPNPISEFSVNSSCQGINSIFLSSSQAPSGGGAISSLIWQWGDGSPVFISSGATFTNTALHIYTVASQFVAALTASTTMGCSHTSTQLVNVNQQPEAEFGMTNNPSVAQEPVYFSDFSTPNGAIVDWYWQFGDETASSGSAPTHNYLNAGIYVIKLTVTDNRGCSDTISKSIEVNLLPQVPTAFTPNNDNNNDLLFVKGGPFEKLKFRVYDNWGVLLFETTDQKIGWDGKKDGVDQPVGVYVWTLEVDMYNNRQVKKNGDVTLIR